MKWQFWRWLFLGLNQRSGLRQLWNRYLIVHAIVGVGVAMSVPVPPHEAAQTILFPFVGIVFGLSFARLGVAQGLLQEREMVGISQYHPDGIQTYVYTFQLAVLIIIFALLIWALAGMKVFDSLFGSSSFWIRFMIETFLYFIASLAVRECWDVIKATHIMILFRNHIKEKSKEI